MVDDYIYRRLAVVQQRIDEARRYSEPYPDWRLLNYMSESEKRYKMAYEALMVSARKCRQ
ncbi:hypothetical protein EG68_04109 [Paragonimus skrjabini miyazakii]|uniref:Uncharacterized protein n=1 Tax=Paragonimus skrjabini miyazakii TaxID=59628 RepID=A0A8S9YVV7_9TREM|nr:hypothetical protein EG68_04109 [Paragonimus skrjabini miyazakii]